MLARMESYTLLVLTRRNTRIHTLPPGHSMGAAT